MISKETFCKALQMIKEQEETDCQFSKALDLVGDGHFVFGVKNKCYTALLMVLKETMNDRGDFIEWWLTEGAPNYLIWSADKKDEWCLKEPEVLYDYLFEVYPATH